MTGPLDRSKPDNLYTGKPSARNAIISEERKRSLVSLGVVGVFILAIGSFFQPDRVWCNLFLAAFYLLTLGLGGAVFVALTYVTGAGWHVAYRRVPEAMAKTLPITGGAVLLLLLIRIREVGWQLHDGGAVGTFWFKQMWLTPSFWFLRSVFYVGVWTVLAKLLVDRSRQADAHPSVFALRNGSVRLSAVFLVVYALTFSLASVDWLMALEPMWFSTMWGVYNFSGTILAALAAVTMLCIRLSRTGAPLHGYFKTDHLHDLGKLLIGFSCFWMYIWFCQYMLIWYTNIPEETSYFVTRIRGPWGPIVVVSIIVNWVVPFFVLLPRPAKRSKRVMWRVASVLLIGRWVDLYLMIFPPVLGDTPVFGLFEVIGLVSVSAFGIVLFERAFREAAPVPQGDIFLPESLDYHA